MTTPRVLVVSGSAGHGHVMAAEAITEALHAGHPGVDAAHLDALTRMAVTYSRIYRWGYVELVDKHPILWRLLYDATDRRLSKVGHMFTVMGGRRFIDAVRKWNPDVVLCTHFLAPELISRAMRKGKLKPRLEVVVTDHDVHRMWYWPEVAHYYVGSDPVKARLAMRYGVPDEHISVTGIPVRKMFTKRHNKPVVRERYGIDPDRPVVVFLSGGFATGRMGAAITGIWMERRDAQVIAICGRNARLRRRIAALPRPTGAVLRPLGFTRDVAEVLAIADVVVGKSGGISTSECAAMGKPLVVSGAIPGQEERNAYALARAGAGVFAPTPEEVRFHVGRLLEDPKLLRSMSRAAKAFGRPNAAADVAAAVAAAAAPRRAQTGPHFHGAV